MNLSDFSLLKEDHSNYTIGHPKGKSITVSKKGLSDKAQQLISKLKKNQNFDEGGEAEEADIPQGPTPTPTPSPIDVNPSAEEQGEEPGDKELEVEPIEPAVTANAEQAGAPATTAGSAPTASETPPTPQTSALPNVSGPLKKAIGATEFSLGEEKKLATQSAKGFKEAATSLEALPTANDLFQKSQINDQTFQDMLRNQSPIDQNRYWNNKSTGSKITAGLGMLLGGIGAGLTHGPNLAVEHINNAINNDIESQKNDQSKTMNLWKMNRENLVSAQAADLATQNHYLSIAKVKAEQAAAQTQSPLAQQKIAPVILGYEQQIAQNNWMMSRMQGGASGTEQQHVGELQTMQQLRPDLYKDMESKYIPGVGTSRVPVSEGDRTALKTYDVLGNSIDQAINFANTKGTTFPIGVDNAEANTIRQNLVTGFQTLHDLKRLSDVDLKYNLSNISSPGAIMTKQAIAQFKTLKSELDNKKNVEYKQLGITPFQKAPQDIQAAAWANANPNDPKAAKILQVLGGK